MRTGASGVCSMGGVTSECNSAELRFWYGDEQIFKDNIKFCIDNNIYMICNFDFHDWNGHRPFDMNRLNDMLTIMFECGCTKSNSRITVENEPMKYWSKEFYASMINQTYQRIQQLPVADRFYVGAGNEEFGLAAAKGNMYEYILENCTFDYLDIHIQSTMIDSQNDWRVVKSRVHHWLNAARYWAATYNKKLSCTEANWSRIKTANGHNDLMKERQLAKFYGCEDFNIVFVDGITTTKHWLDYQINGVQNSPYWPDLKQRMLNEKKEEEIMAYLRPIVQQEFYDAMGWEKPYHDNTPSLPIVGRKDANQKVTMADLDAIIETILKGIVSALKTNAALPGTFPEPMDIKYNPDGSWNGNWKEVAQSNPDE